MRFTQRRWDELRLFIRVVRKAPSTVQLGICLAILLIVSLTINWVYHAFNKPSELFSQ
ncbi:MAG: hypothetical protein OEY60_16465 [Nitrospira sp.]|nr:hypothetical protein [Nitrospira sp.]